MLLQKKTEGNLLCLLCIPSFFVFPVQTTTGKVNPVQRTSNTIPGSGPWSVFYNCIYVPYLSSFGSFSETWKASVHCYCSFIHCSATFFLRACEVSPLLSFLLSLLPPSYSEKVVNDASLVHKEMGASLYKRTTVLILFELHCCVRIYVTPWQPGEGKHNFMFCSGIYIWHLTLLVRKLCCVYLAIPLLSSFFFSCQFSLNSGFTLVREMCLLQRQLPRAFAGASTGKAACHVLLLTSVD